MIDRRALLASGAVLPLVLVGCGAKKASATEPPEINFGRDTCVRCRMIISEARFASGIVDADGNAQIFDDAGEMVQTVQSEGIGNNRVWVHGSPSLEWLDAKDAWYAATMEVPTPMGTGLFPFDTHVDAGAFAAERSATVYDWDELIEIWTSGSHQAGAGSRSSG